MISIYPQSPYYVLATSNGFRLHTVLQYHGWTCKSRSSVPCWLRHCHRGLLFLWTTQSLDVRKWTLDKFMILLVQYETTLHQFKLLISGDTAQSGSARPSTCKTLFNDYLSYLWSDVSTRNAWASTRHPWLHGQAISIVKFTIFGTCPQWQISCVFLQYNT